MFVISGSYLIEKKKKIPSLKLFAGSWGIFISKNYASFYIWERKILENVKKSEKVMTMIIIVCTPPQVMQGLSHFSEGLYYWGFRWELTL